MKWLPQGKGKVRKRAGHRPVLLQAYCFFLPFPYFVAVISLLCITLLYLGHFSLLYSTFVRVMVAGGDLFVTPPLWHPALVAVWTLSWPSLCVGTVVVPFSFCENCCHAILYPVGVFHDMCCMHSVLLLYADWATLCVPYSTLPYSLLLGCGHTLPVVLCVGSLLYTTLFLTAVVLYLYADVAISWYVYSLYSNYIMWLVWTAVCTLSLHPESCMWPGSVNPLTLPLLYFAWSTHFTATFATVYRYPLRLSGQAGPLSVKSSNCKHIS